MKTVGIIRDPLYLKHSNGDRHPECASRLLAIDDMLREFPRRESLKDLPARDADPEELARIHTEPHIERIRRSSGRERTIFDADTGAGADSYAAALRAAGGVIEAVEAVMREEVEAAIALVRPPGHHAEADRPMGFCLFNNAAVAAAHAVECRGLERVLIVDWDVHHGNGTAGSFYDTDRVLYFSVHEYPHYPGTGGLRETGGGAGDGCTVNVPLGAGQRDEDYACVFHRILKPIADQYRPQLILVSAGFDAHESDPLAAMNLTDRGFAWMTEWLVDIAGRTCPGKIVLTLEGGYSLPALQSGVKAVLQALLARHGGNPEIPRCESSYLDRILKTVAEIHGARWHGLSADLRGEAR